MKDPIPTRLRREPLLEALWEVRFSSDRAPVSDILPGLVYRALAARYGKLTRLPAANIPHPIAEHDEGLRYVPTIRLEGAPFSIQLGERSVSLSCRRPYAGWTAFFARITELASVLQDTGLLSTPERISLKYVDLIELDTPPSLACLDLSLALGGRDVEEYPVQLRTELVEDGVVHVLQVASPAQARVGAEEPASGVLVEIDTIVKVEAKGFWDRLEERLEHAHTLSKRMFFNLLTPETLSRLDPEYGSGGGKKS